jgi:anion-transporting  ArsA/GET3 family ATPase
LLEDFISEKRVLICIGAGGVGKTTTSIGLAIRGAIQGKRVALLSIDPAKRLASALGIKLSNDLSEIKFGSEHGVSGSVHAAMLDQKAVFDEMVSRHAPSLKIRDSILQNPIYVAASTNLAGPLEYMALAKLRDLVYDERFDLVVLDTPPDTHALDFLARPNILASFFEQKAMSWLLKPFHIANKLGLGKLMSVGEKMMGGVAKVAGMKALRSFADFLVLCQDVLEGFNQSGEQTLSILKDERTSFLLVTTPTGAACRSSIYLHGLLKELGYGCDCILFNRCLPDGQFDPGSVSPKMEQAFDILVKRQAGEVQAKELLTKSLGLDRAASAIQLISIPEQTEDLHSLESILRFSKSI